MTPGFKTIAWNGISMDVPVDWHLANLGADHLLLEDDKGPALEITWAGKFKPGRLEAVMTRFVRRAQQRFAMAVTPFFPSQFPVALASKIELAWFAWALPPSRGQGVLLGCSQCRRLFILRFFNGASDMPGSLVKKVVSSFNEGCGKGRGEWKLFGLEFFTPEGIRLSNYSFRPGSFMMEFRARAQRQTVYSWGPAAFLLSTGDLEAVARKRVALPDTAPVSRGGDQTPCLVWDWGKRGLPFGLMRQSQQFSICHNRKNNRIIALHAWFRGRHWSRPWDMEKIMKGGLG